MLHSVSPGGYANRVPSHNELNIELTQCRACTRSYGRANHRRDHEIQHHRFSFRDGETFSPTPFVAPVYPHLQDLSGQSTGSLVTANSPMATSPGPQLFATPDTPCRRSSSQPLSGPRRTRLSSTRSSSVCPVPPPSSSQPPPSSPSDLPSPSPSPGPSSTGSSNHSSPSLSPSPGPSSGTKCRYCLYDFSTPRLLSRHLREKRCPYVFTELEHNITEYCVLRRPENYQVTKQILEQLEIPQRVQMCRINNWSMPGVWPIVFPGRSGRGGHPPILAEMTAFDESTTILQTLIREDSTVQLPRQVIVVDQANDIQSVMPAQVLTPGSAFSCQVVGDQIRVSSGNHF